MIELHRSNAEDVELDLERQFKTLHNRAQLLLAICGVVLSASVLITTGRILGQPAFEIHELTGWMLGLAGITDITATAVVISGVLNIRWLTQMPGQDLRTWVMRALQYRDHKTSAYRVALRLLLLSMLCYQAAVLLIVTRL